MQVTKWILLRGLGRDARHWFEFPKQLQSHAYKVECLDLPGFGLEHKSSSPFTISGITHDLRQKIRNQLNKDANIGVLGISLGGMVAMDWASSHPTDFKKMVLINVSSRDTGDLWQRISPFGMFKTLEALFQNKNIRAREKAVLEMVSNLKNKDEELLDQLEKMAMENSPSLLNFSKQLIAASRFIAPEQLHLPTLFLASIKDHMVDVRCTKQLAERTGQSIKFHSNAGHDLVLDDPEWVVEKLLEFDRSEPNQGPSLQS